MTPQKRGFAMVEWGGVWGDENIHNLGWYSEGFGCDTIILGLTQKSAGLPGTNWYYNLIVIPYFRN